jgi:hypothetical protein
MVRQPEKDWRINKGDPVLVEDYYFEKRVPACLQDD